MKAVVVLSIFLYCSQGAFATDCDSLIQTASSDSGYNVVSAADTTVYLSAEDFGPRFQFGYVADSCHVYWHFAEVFINRRKVYLSNWCHKRLINWNAQADEPEEEWSPAELNARSTTRVFPVTGGDTLQFYRTISWKDRLLDDVSFNRYVNPNGLSYSVEVVDINTNSRILLLDTLNMSQVPGTTKPCIYSWFPIAARVRQVIPSTQDSVDAVIRFNVFAVGANPRSFYRKDRMGRMMSAYDLSHSYWNNYIDSVEANILCQSGVSCGFTADVSPSPAGVTISTSGSSSMTTMDLCDIYGTIIWSAAPPAPNTPLFVPCNSGLKIIVGRSNGQAVCTRKVVVP